MKVALKKSVLEKALKIGGAASLSEEALTNTSNVSQIIQSVKITADDKNLTFESVNVSMASKTVIPMGIVTEDNVKLMADGEGSILVNAKLFSDWVGWQKNSAVIGISFSKSPDVHEPEGEEDLSIKKVGKVKLVSKDKSSTQQNWELDCIDPEQATEFVIKKSAEKQFSVPPKQFAESVKSVAFACNPTDSDHIYDNISFQHVNGAVYMAGTNGARMAIANLSEATNVDNTDKLLIPFGIMSQISELVLLDPDSPVLIMYDKTDTKVIAKQGKSVIRVICKDSEKAEKFHDISGFVKDGEYTKFGTLSKEDLVSLLGAATMGGNDSALFSFDKEEKRVEILAKPDKGAGSSKAMRNAIDDLDKDLKVVWSVKYLQDGLKVIKSKSIPFMLPSDNMNSVKVVDTDNVDFSYFIRKSDNPRYASELDES